MTFLDFAEKIITKEKRPLTQNEIWKLGEENNFHKDLNTKGLTPWQTLGSSIRKDIRDNPDTRFIKFDDDTLKYYLKSLPEIKSALQNDTNKSIKKSKDHNKFDEKDLHKYLSFFVYEKDKIYTKTINAQESSKWFNSIWRHPDIVGVTYPNWEEEVLELSKDIESYGIKFFSYELKKELNSGNLRQHYFEAVSNSSWANEGYLVAAIISEDNDFFEEFKRLNNSFGIGLIRISMEDPSDNEILFPSKYNVNIDIESINVLSKINKGFKDFLIDVKSDYKTIKRLRGQYDRIFKVEELYKI